MPNGGIIILKNTAYIVAITVKSFLNNIFVFFIKIYTYATYKIQTVFERMSNSYHIKKYGEY